MDAIAFAQERLKNDAVISYSDEPISGHAMTIVGQQKSKKNGQCEFIIRNTYGDDCGASIKGFPEYKTKTCDGHFIISAPMLLENIQNTYALSPTQKGQMMIENRSGERKSDAR